MARGKNLKAPQKDMKLLRQEKILKRIEEKQSKKRKSRVA